MFPGASPKRTKIYTTFALVFFKVGPRKHLSIIYYNILRRFVKYEKFRIFYENNILSYYLDVRIMKFNKVGENKSSNI